MKDSDLGPARPQLPSGNIEITELFFNQILKFPTVAKYSGHGYLIVKRGDAEIHFWQTSTPEEGKQYGSLSSCYIHVKDLEAIFHEYKKSKVIFRCELEKKPWGMNEMQIDDPFGNAIRFGEAIS